MSRSFGVAAGDEAGEIGGLPDEVRQRRRCALRMRARLAGRQEHVRMHDHGAHAARAPGICLTRGWSMPTVSTRPPNRRRRDVVDVQRAARHLLALPWRTSAARAARSGCGSSALAATTAATAEAAEPPRPEPERNALVDLACSKPKSGRSASMHAPAARGPAVLLLRIERQLAGDAARSRGSRRRASARRVTVTRSPSASTAKPEDVEADGDVADRGGRECGRALRGPRALTGAPRGTPTGAAGRRTRRRRSPRDPRPGPAR